MMERGTGIITTSPRCEVHPQLQAMEMETKNQGNVLPTNFQDTRESIRYSKVNTFTSRMMRTVASPSLTPVAQLLFTFSTGILFSCWTVSLVVVLAFLVLYEALYDSLIPQQQRPPWQYQLRIGVILSYIAGWLVGRSLLDLGVSFLSPNDDHERLGKHSLCKRRNMK